MREKPLILVVEDNPASRDIMEARLVANDYSVITAADGEEGLHMAKTERPDLILAALAPEKTLWAWASIASSWLSVRSGA